MAVRDILKIMKRFCKYKALRMTGGARMTGIKLCGLTRMEDIEAVNELKPEYVGFVFWKKSKRCVSPEQAEQMKRALSEEIKAVGVFVDEDSQLVAELLERNIIDMAQLHGNEDEEYIGSLRKLTDKPIIKAFRITSQQSVEAAVACSADYILLDAGMGEGSAFDWSLIGEIGRPYFLAGGLNCDNVKQAVEALHPFAVDVSSGIETDGRKDRGKMTEFVSAVRN